MRSAGLYFRDGEASPDMEDAILGGVSREERGHVYRFAAGQGNPHAVFLVSEAANPSLTWATRPDGSFAVLDGEIYNAADLYQVDGKPAAGGAEAALAIYFSEGEAGLAKVDAAAFVAIWDAQREQLLLVRDLWGKVPGFYAELPNGIVWASDIGTILRAGVDTKLNLPALDFFLSNGFVPAPWTLAERVSKIPPGHLLCCSNSGSIELRRYWRPRTQPKLDLDPDAVTEGFREHLEKALHRHWSPGAGVLLSGGVDSKTILAGLREFLGVSPDAFTFNYTDYEGAQNELAAARRAAEHFGCKHYELTFRPSDIPENLEWFVRSYGQPFTTGLHTCMLRDVVKAGTTVLISGTGPDGWNLGKRNHYGLKYGRLPSLVMKLGEASLPLVRPINRDLAETWEDVIWCAETRFPSRCHEMITPERTRSAIYSDAGWVDQGCRAKMELLQSAAEAYAGESDRDRIMLLNRQFTNAEGSFYWNHHWGRAHGLVIRFPFMSDINDFVLQLELKGRNKDEMRRLAATLMPQELAYAGRYPQSLPIGHWLRGPLKDFLRDQLAPARLKESGLFDPAGVQTLVDRHLQGGTGHGMSLWAIITVLVWKDLASRKEL
jgi:asparagine synthase (glutamine-hydrolysing)